MKVKALHNLNYNGKWYSANQTFNAADSDIDGMREYVTVIDTASFVSDVFPPDTDTDSPKRRGRPPKKTE